MVEVKLGLGVLSAVRKVVTTCSLNIGHSSIEVWDRFAKSLDRCAVHRPLDVEWKVAEQVVEVDWETEITLKIVSFHKGTRMQV